MTNRLLFEAGVSAMHNYYSIGFDDMACGGNTDTPRARAVHRVQLQRHRQPAARTSRVADQLPRLGLAT